MIGIFLLLYKSLKTGKELEVGFIWDEDATRSSIHRIHSEERKYSIKYK